MRDFERLAERAALWFNGALPPEQQVSSYDIRLEGPPTSVPGIFHTYACLYPAEGEYVVFGLTNSPVPSLSGEAVRQKIAGCVIPPAKLQDQRNVIKGYRGANFDPAVGWSHSVGLSLMYELPVAMLLHGLTEAGGIETTFMRVMLFAPADHALREFQRAAPISME